jgi:hypothetical protein
MAEPCPECGAIQPDGKPCQAIFDDFLVLEFSDPAFGEVHMLTVACFMIQHERYSDEGLRWIEKQLRDHLEGNVPVERIRRQAGREADQANRSWKVTRQPGARPLPKIAWSMTIADVDTGCRDEHGEPDAARYCELIRRWAGLTLREMRPAAV